jgi:hypothetical protein
MSLPNPDMTNLELEELEHRDWNEPRDLIKTIFQLQRPSIGFPLPGIVG